MSESWFGRLVFFVTRRQRDHVVEERLAELAEYNVRREEALAAFEMHGDRGPWLRLVAETTESAEVRAMAEEYLRKIEGGRP